MREVLEKTVGDERVTSHPGTFEHIGFEDGSADLVVAAQVRVPCGFPTEIEYGEIVIGVALVSPELRSRHCKCAQD